MTERLNVLLVESHARAGERHLAELEAAGHHVLRCHGPRESSFPCAGIRDADACPLEQGIDIALVVRSHVAPIPTALEDGVSCAIRAGLPIVEDGPTVLDPFEPWLAVRVTGDVVSTCEEVAGRRFDPLRLAVLGRIAALLATADVDPASVECRIRQDGPRLDVHLDGPSLGNALEHAVAVRVLDAVRADG